ncbi:hypothetical protein ESCO_005954 [Escovopsis weberi]|uniref:F-box domain-containing protein n=1 Tax=Escovopsis weberi TaxID=150374 RepID=A0A0M8MYM7_ESCWE|nr:hypothetical protein ESCO_005954 [Escovopsis weberi]
MATIHSRDVPPIQTLPLEILWRIASHLSTTDFCSIRLSCRGLEKALLQPFATDFFTRKQFMMSDFSLGALVDIARSRLGPCLKSVHLGLDQLGVSAVVAYGLTPAEHARYHQLQEDGYMDSSREFDLLTEAFRHLGGLESIVIRDFNSNTRHRDGQGQHWRSYGALTIQRETGVRPRVMYSVDGKRDAFDPTTIFSLVLRCLGQAQARPTSLRIYARRGGQLHDDAFSLPEVDSERESVARVLAGLKELHLCIQPRYYQPIPPGPAHLLLRRLLVYTQSLEELRINCANELNSSPLSESFAGFLRWLAIPVSQAAPPGQEVVDAASSSEPSTKSYDHDPNSITNPIPPPIALSRLRVLSFGSLTASAEDILAVISKFARHLERLELWRLTLIPHNSFSSAPTRTSGCPWITLFRGLLEIPDLKLTSLLVGRVRGSSRVSSDGFIRFVDEDAVMWDRDLPVEVRYQGPDWRSFVQGLSMMYHSASEAQLVGRKALQTYITKFGGNGDANYEAEIARRAAKLEHTLSRTVYRVGGSEEYQGAFFEDVESEWIHDQMEYLEDEPLESEDDEW